MLIIIMFMVVSWMKFLFASLTITFMKEFEEPCENSMKIWHGFSP